MPMVQAESLGSRIKELEVGQSFVNFNHASCNIHQRNCLRTQALLSGRRAELEALVRDKALQRTQTEHWHQQLVR